MPEHVEQNSSHEKKRVFSVLQYFHGTTEFLLVHQIIKVVHITKSQDGYFVENTLIIFTKALNKPLGKAAFTLWSYEKSTKGISDNTRKEERVSSGLKLQSSCLI